MKINFAVFSLVALAGFARPVQAAKPTVCGDGAISGAEVCDKGPPLELDAKSCASFGFSGGSLGCASDCASFGTGACTPAAGSCRMPPAAVPTTFDAHSLIIDMSGIKCSSVRPLGLAWYLLGHGIRIAWVLDTAKAAITDPDITSMNVERYAWSGAYDSFVASASKAFASGPLVIPAADADRALHLIYEGVLPQDPRVKFGWNNQTSCGAPGYCASYASDVPIYRSTGAFTAKVLRIASLPPRKVALYAATNSWLLDVFDRAELGFSAGQGVPPASSGLLFDLIQTEAGVASYLRKTSYEVAWIANSSIITGTSRPAFQSFVAAGGGLVAAGAATLQLDADPATRYMSMTPLTHDNGNGPATAPQIPGNPYTQLGQGQEYKTLTGDTQGFVLGTAFKPCVVKDVDKGGGIYSFLVRDDRSVGGTIAFIAGSNYGNTCNTDNMAAWQRTLLNMLFGTDGETELEHPFAGEISRSSPIVVENTASAKVISLQGSMEMPAAMQNTVFDPARDTAWVFPAARGHLRAHDMSGSPALDAFASLGAAWDGASHLPASRYLYTSAPAGPAYGLSRVSVEAAGASALAGELGYAAADAAKLINRVRVGALGAVDRATPAYVGPGESVTFNGYQRPAVVYAAALDGMLHAFRVPDLENAAATSWDWSSADELWGFVPRDQLSQLRTNDQALQASPAVADLFGAFLENDGSPSAAAPAGSRDATSEWVTVLALPSYRKDGRGALALLDVTNPDAGDSHCPQQWAGGVGGSCRHGPNPLWSRSSSAGITMGRATGSSIGVVKQGATYRPAVFVTTDTFNPAAGQGGVRLFAFDATTGDDLWPTTGALTFAYHRPMAGQLSMPNEPPAAPALVDRSGGLSGYQTDLFFGDWEGKVWRVSDLGNDPPTAACLWDATAGGACSAVSCAGGTCTNTDSGAATRPIAAPVVVYFLEDNPAGQLHLFFASGGAYWAPASSASGTYQVVTDLDVTGATASSAYSKAFDASSGVYRVYAAPVMMNRDIYVTASAGLADVLSDWRSDAAGSIYRFQAALSGGSFTYTPSVVQTGAGLSSASALGVTRNNDRLIVTTKLKTGVLAPTSPGSGAGSTSPNQGGAGVASSATLQMWLPNAR